MNNLDSFSTCGHERRRWLTLLVFLFLLSAVPAGAQTFLVQGSAYDDPNSLYVSALPGHTSFKYFHVLNLQATAITVTISHLNTTNFRFSSNSLSIPANSSSGDTMFFSPSSSGNIADSIRFYDGSNNSVLTAIGEAPVDDSSWLYFSMDTIPAYCPRVGQTGTTHQLIWSLADAPVSLDGVYSSNPRFVFSFSSDTLYPNQGTYLICKFTGAHPKWDLGRFQLFYHVNGRALSRNFYVRGFTDDTTYFGDSTRDTLGRMPCPTARLTPSSWGPIHEGDSLIDTLVITNPNSHAMALSLTMSDTSGNFQLLNVPDSVGASSAVKILLLITPENSRSLNPSNDSGNFNFLNDITLHSIGTGGDTSCSSTTSSYGLTYRDSSFTIDQHDLPSIVMQQKNIQSTRVVTFVNNLGKDVTINGVSMANGSHFTVSGLKDPLIIPAGQALTLVLSFTAVAPGIYRDTLIITNNLSSRVTRLAVTGIHSSSSSVDISSYPSLQLMLSPNPTRGTVEIRTGGVRIGAIEIFDAIGNILVSHELKCAGVGESSWTWDGLSATGGSPGSGAYFVRLSGFNDHGQAIVLTRQLRIAR